MSLFVSQSWKKKGVRVGKRGVLVKDKAAGAFFHVVAAAAEQVSSRLREIVAVKRRREKQSD